MKKETIEQLKAFFTIPHRIIFLFGSLAVIFYAACCNFPAFTEAVYSQGIFRGMIYLLNGFNRLFSFAIAPVFLIVFIFFCLFFIIRRCKILKKYPFGVFKSVAVDLITVVLLCFGIFVFCWGCNYQRLPLSWHLGFDTAPATAAELESVCVDLAAKASALRLQIPEDAEGVACMADASYLYEEADLAYGLLAEENDVFIPLDTRTKVFPVSRWMSYAGLTGIYLLWAGEPTVNGEILSVSKAYSVLHEQAHQQGFAREDEANFLAYYAGKCHPDAFFRYSAYLLALTHAGNALAKADREAYSQLFYSYNEGIIRDLKANIQFWQAFEGPVEKISTEVNDRYLQATGAADGVQSYGRMVDLLIGEYRYLNK